MIPSEATTPDDKGREPHMILGMGEVPVMLRGLLAIMAGLAVTAVAVLLLPNSVRLPHVHVVAGAAVVGLVARRHRWLHGALMGAVVAAIIIWIIVRIVHGYSDNFWRKPDGELDLHLALFGNCVTIVVVGAVAAELAGYLARIRHRARSA